MAKDHYTRKWTTSNALTITKRYAKGVLTVRALYYQLVSIGMTNSIPHYKRVVSAMGIARRKGLIPYEAFSDHDRIEIGQTEYQKTTVSGATAESKSSIKSIMVNYDKNRWENQPNFVEVWIEKKALQGVFQPVCEKMKVALCPCKGYSSLTFLSNAAKRYKQAIKDGKKPVILYFGDYDATGLDIPRKIKESLLEDFGLDMEVKPVCLNKTQVQRWKLPHAISKPSDSRTKAFLANGGLGQVELDAVDPHKLQRIAKFAINKHFDKGLYKQLLKTQAIERIQYKEEMIEFVKTL